jgi:translation initiation factor IF-2
MSDEENPQSDAKAEVPTLKLNRSFDSSRIRQNFTHGRSKTVTVEVKRKRFAINKPETASGEDINGVNSRAAAIKNAAEAARLAEENRKSEDILKQEKIALQRELEEEVAIEPAENEERSDINLVGENPVTVNVDDQYASRKSELGESKKKLFVKPGSDSTDSGSFVESDDSSRKPKPEQLKTAKTKYDDSRKLVGKINAHTISDDDDIEISRPRSLSALRRRREKVKRGMNAGFVAAEKQIKEVILPESITVQELSNRMSERVADVTKELMKLGMLVTGSQIIDADTAELIIETFGHKVKRVTEGDVENILNFSDSESELVRRFPVVTIMGHVDHGKTSLLDALRSSDVALGEAGGITQHIGAYQITLASGDHITFIDTPGHEAFTAMRSRGAKATDIVVLVVAADDGIMAQTIEAIHHAKAAEVPIIVAINKIDKPGADTDRVRNELLQHGLIAEALGGDTLIVEVSAKQKLNLDKLEEAILLQAEMLNLRANPNANASGMVIESKIVKNRGVVTSFLVQRGTLKVGDLVVAGGSYGKVKILHDDKGRMLKEGLPSMPVEMLGLESSCDAGEPFHVVETEKQAREITEYRHQKKLILKNSLNKRGSLEELFMRSANGEIKELPIIIKADVQGSIEAISGSIQKFNGDEVKVKILHTAVGGITESDVALAHASNAIILGFNVRANSKASLQAENDSVDIRYYSIIYNLIDDIKAILSGMLSPIIREEYIGRAEIRKVYNITKFGKIAGSYVTSGYISRGAGVRLLRDDVVIHEGKLKTLRRFKEDVKDVKEGFECGIAFENYEDIRENDQVEVFKLVEEARSL